jgi:hypothetical protein
LSISLEPTASKPQTSFLASRTHLMLIVVALLFPRLTVAECVLVSLGDIAEHTAVVFSGTVTDVTVNAASAWPSEIVTFDVDRVWKGVSTRQVVIYSFTRSVEPFHFTIGTRYVTLAHIQTAEERNLFGLAASGPPTFGMGQCGDGTREYTIFAAEVAELGPGREPGQ